MSFSKTICAAAGVILTAALLSACGGGSSTSSGGTPAAGTQAYVDALTELKGDFAEDVVLTAGQDYKITGEVNFLSGTTLTIPAGTTLYGTTPSTYLAINAGAQINAVGTAANPIIFTSADDYNGASTKDAQGEWGGVVLIGNAPIVGGTLNYEAGTQVGGGVDPHDNSGTMQYVMIKHTGFEVEVDKELNGLSFLAVGDGTTIDNIAILGSADDGIELWGGTVNLTNVYVYNAGDDSLDTDLGYTGTFDNAVAVQNVVDKTNYDSSGIEAGNDSDSYTSVGGTSGVIGDATLANNTQATMATYKNITIDAVGGAIYLKNDAGGIFDNVLVTSDDPTATGLVATANQAVVTHRTTDTVDDLSGTPYGIQIAAGGLALINAANPGMIYATETAKGSAAGGCDPLDAGTDGAPNCTGHIADYWTTNNPDVANLTEGSAGTVTGADQSVFGWVLNVLNAKPTVVVSGDITTDTTWTEGTNYALQGEVNVKNGAVLTVQPGVTVYGLTPSTYLAINAGSQIIADGTLAKPIVFTSAADVAGANGTTTHQGQWGGLTLIGNAPIVGGTLTYEAGTQVGGGTDPNDNSGILRYVAVKNTGFEVEVDKELNGLSMLAVGDGTTVENVAILSSADDGIELWGGTVNITGLYVYDAGDDSFDTDLGYTGTFTDGYAEQYIVDKTNYDSSGIESGNDSDSYTSVGGTSGVIGDTTLANNTQATMATYHNVTIDAVGGAIYLKNDAGGIFDNVLVYSFDPTAPGLVATANQAVVTHRTTDTVDDLSGTPYGIQINAGGLALINAANPGVLYAAETAKNSASGGCDPLDAGTNGAPNCTGHIADYWTTNNPDVANLSEDAVGSVTGVTIANVWKGNAGTND